MKIVLEDGFGEVVKLKVIIQFHGKVNQLTPHQIILFGKKIKLI